MLILSSSVVENFCPSKPLILNMDSEGFFVSLKLQI